MSADLHIRFGSLAVGKVGTDKSGSVPSHDSQGRQSLRVKASGLLQKSMSTLKRQNAVYDWQISCPSCVHRKQPLLVQIQMQGGEDSAAPSRPPLPVLELVKVIATIDVQTDAQGEAN